jgi:hypothetical protein
VVEEAENGRIRQERYLQRKHKKPSSESCSLLLPAKACDAKFRFTGSK